MSTNSITSEKLEDINRKIGDIQKYVDGIAHNLHRFGVDFIGIPEYRNVQSVASFLGSVEAECCNIVADLHELQAAVNSLASKETCETE